MDITLNGYLPIKSAMPSKIAPILNYSTRQNVLSNGLALSKQKSSSSFLHDVIFQTFQGLPKQFQCMSRLKILFSSNNSCYLSH